MIRFDKAGIVKVLYLFTWMFLKCITEYHPVIVFLWINKAKCKAEAAKKARTFKFPKKEKYISLVGCFGQS